MPTTPSTRGYAPRMSNDRAGRYAEFSWFNDLQTPSRDFQLFGPLFTAQAWTSMPVNDAGLFGLSALRKRVDLTGYTQARLCATPGAVAGEANSTLRLQYSVDNGTTWLNIDGVASVTATLPQTGQSAIRLDTATASTPAAGAWVTLDPAARADVLIRATGNVPTGGAGTTSPTFHAVAVQFRH